MLEEVLEGKEKNIYFRNAEIHKERKTIEKIIKEVK